MSPNEREWGAITTRLDQAVHAQRNARMILDGLVADTHELRAEIAKLRAEIAKLRLVLRTTLSVLAVTVAALAWVVELVMR